MCNPMEGYGAQFDVPQMFNYEQQNYTWDNQYLDTKTYPSCKYNNHQWFYGANDYENNAYYTQTYDYYQPHQQFNPPSEESDIIVEESDDDEVTDYSEDIDNDATNKCVVCNLVYTTSGLPFYTLTAESPLTMSTHVPVLQRITTLIIGKLTPNKNYLCNECLGLINTIDHLKFKLKTYENEFETKFKNTCQINNIKFLPPKNKNVKLRKTPRIRCKKCNKTLSLYNYCLHHKKKHQKLPERYLCESCGLTFKNKLKFITHSRFHKQLKCTNCPKIFKTRTHLREHKNFCLGLLPYKCTSQQCNKKFPTTTKLKNHVKLKHEKKFIAICSICNIGFVKLSDYKSHKISHNTNKKFNCLKCNKSYKTLSNLNFHMKVHEAKLPYVCTICQKGFLRKEYLETHMNNHNNVKNFSCGACPKKFASQKNLDAHFKYHDGSLKRSTCNVCGKTMSSGFEDHLRMHNNLREFECGQCDMKFNTKGTLNKHVKSKHFYVDK